MRHHIDRSKNESCVQAWTDTLPYCGAGKESPSRRREPYHRSLCDAIRALESSVKASGALEAAWTTERQSKRDPDMENLLIWDVARALPCATDFLCFERQNGPVPTPPTLLGFTALHHLRYEAVRRPTSANNTILAECGPVTCKFEDLKKPAETWKLFKQNMVRSDHVGNRQPGYKFNAQITISGPDKVNLADWKMVKAILDGFVASLHYYEGDQLDPVSERIKDQLGKQASEWRELLLCQSNAVLGPWRVPHLKPNGLAWSPCDHLLVRAEIIRDHCIGGHWSITGRLTSNDVAH